MSGSILILTAGRSNVGRNYGIVKEGSGSELRFPDAKKEVADPCAETCPKGAPGGVLLNFFVPQGGGCFGKGSK